MKLIHYDKTGNENDISNLVRRFNWSGDYREAARKLEVSIAVSATDQILPKVSIDLADGLIFYDGSGNELFGGYVFRKTKSISSNELTIMAYDGLIYLVKSRISKVFIQAMPEEITKQVCTDLGIETGGALAQTNVPVSFPHLDKTGYEAIQTAYTIASKQTGKVYMPRMVAGKLEVIEKGELTAQRLVLSSQHITDSMYREDLESMVNQVIITDENGNRIGDLSNNDWIQNYGVLQAVYQKEDDKDARTMASDMLKGIDSESNIELIGGPDAYDIITGNALRIEEGFTGLTGLFYIDNDMHTFENGQHTISLIVNFQNVMDEQNPDKFKEDKASSKNTTLSLTLGDY